MKSTLLSSEPLTSSQIEDLRLAASKMQGAASRAFQAEMAIKYCFGSPRLTETVFGWGRENVTLGLAEKRNRYRGQRRTTIMAKVTKRFVDETLWPEFEELQATLVEYFDQFIERIIGQVLNADTSEVEERSDPDAQVPSLKQGKG